MARDDPHAVDAFFKKRLEKMLKFFFGKLGFEVEWWWVRWELQARGDFHVLKVFRP